jgi:hypothetical protein
MAGAGAKWAWYFSSVFFDFAFLRTSFAISKEGFIRYWKSLCFTTADAMRCAGINSDQNADA